MWLQHWVNHKVPWFWEFHAVHHSQPELNFFTDYRYHVVEYFVRHTILSIPFSVLTFDTPTIVIVSLMTGWCSKFYHGNIRANLGLLKYLLVTPQSHRVHHSKENKHRDKNFGSILSVWDYLFGTQYRDYDEYPDTGIRDDAFPMEGARQWSDLLVTPIIQMAYPFRKILGG